MYTIKINKNQYELLLASIKALCKYSKASHSELTDNLKEISNILLKTKISEE